MNSVTTIRELQKLAAASNGSGAVAEIHVCVTSANKKATRDGKPFYEVAVRDFDDSFMLRVWDNHPAFGVCQSEAVFGFIAITGTFTSGKFGLESPDWSCRPLTPEESQACLAGGETRRLHQENCKAKIDGLISSLAWPFNDFCKEFMREHRPAFERAAAARGHHHARPGGLIEHVALMMQNAATFTSTYPELNRDLLITGALVHDCGKMWENQYEEGSFEMPFTQTAEMLGHIAIGLLVTRKTWDKVIGAEPDQKRRAYLGQARLHLDHLILSHHGTNEWGSPVTPRTPEAMILHFIDNIDARMEMFRSGYAVNAEVAPGIYDRVRPIGNGNLIRPLSPFLPQSETQANSVNSSETTEGG